MAGNIVNKMNPCTVALRELTESLVRVLQHESGVIASKAWSQSLIGEELYQDHSISPREKVAKIIAAVSSRTDGGDKTAFDKFIEILRSESSHQYLADNLLEKVALYKSQQDGHPKAGSGAPGLKDLLKELTPIAHNWQNLGIMLDLDSGKLDNVKANHGARCEDCLREMIKLWLKKVNPPPTWSALAEAVKDINEHKLANEIRKKWCGLH